MTLTAAAEFAATTGAVLIHPFDHPDIVAGQGTVGLEILEQVPDVPRSSSAPAAAACSRGSPRRWPGTGVRVVGAQAEAHAAWPPSLAAGRPGVG